MRSVRLVLTFAPLFVFSLLAALYIVMNPDTPVRQPAAAVEKAAFDRLPAAASGGPASMPVTGVESQTESFGRAEVEKRPGHARVTVPEAKQPDPEVVIATATARPPTPAPVQTEPTPEGPTDKPEVEADLRELPVKQALATQGALPGLEDFVRSVAGGPPEGLRGVYAPEVMALGVVQQPNEDAAFVSPEEDTVTQFRNAEPFGVLGLLAHNYLAGRYFYSLNPGQEIFLVFGDGSTRRYWVTEISQYERLTLGDVHSDFLDLATGQTLDAAQLFARYYDGPHHVTLQTCIEKDGVWNWGVQFTRAEPVD